jgi:hypothetical protein
VLDLVPALDLTHLLRLRVVIARLGEMDNAAWWNTQGVLSRTGTFVYSRGLPHTHSWAQARLVMAVAAARCSEVFGAPQSLTLWSLPVAVEDAFEDQWQEWMDDPNTWESFFARVTALKSTDVLQVLQDFGLASADVIDVASRLRPAPEGGSIPISGISVIDNGAVALLAAGFAQAAPGRLAVPYLRAQS